MGDLYRVHGFSGSANVYCLLISVRVLVHTCMFTLLTTWSSCVFISLPLNSLPVRLKCETMLPQWNTLRQQKIGKFWKNFMKLIVFTFLAESTNCTSRTLTGKITRAVLEKLYTDHQILQLFEIRVSFASDFIITVSNVSLAGSSTLVSKFADFEFRSTDDQNFYCNKKNQFGNWFRDIAGQRYRMRK